MEKTYDEYHLNVCKDGLTLKDVPYDMINKDMIDGALTNNIMAFQYVGLGDTLGSSEYGIYFGLRSGINFAKHVCDLLYSIQYF